jgi:class 3 adenylate cyclase
VLFTDMVDSTRRAAELGDRRWTDLLASHDELARSRIAQHRGRYVHTTGDGLLATFDGPARAVRRARAIEVAVRSIGLSIRAGCHTGEIELVGGDVQGVAVHIGARVAALARPDEVWVSSTVKDLTIGSGLVFENTGEYELKGVPDRWHLYRALE